MNKVKELLTKAKKSLIGTAALLSIILGFFGFSVICYTIIEQYTKIFFFFLLISYVLFLGYKFYLAVFEEGKSNEN